MEPARGTRVVVGTSVGLNGSELSQNEVNKLCGEENGKKYFGIDG
jgi:hypothetical protein